jgi:uncharacterized repeat protein (TIGR03837 family)
MTLDIFCDIIDNYGDIGVVYRLSKELSKKGYNVRIFSNKFSEIEKIIKNFSAKKNFQKLNNIEFINLDEPLQVSYTANIIIESFGCNIPDEYIDKLDEKTKLIINLEYLTAESWVEDFHLKESFSPKSFIKKYFYMPSFTLNSGGIILDNEYLQKVNSIKKDKEYIFNSFYKNLGLKYNSEIFYINIFTYNWNFKNFLNYLIETNKKYCIFILDNRFDGKFILNDKISINYLSYMPQEDFDTWLNISDFNFVRGEESFVRATLSEIPFVWNIYPQENDVHFNKLNAFMSELEKFGISDNYLKLSTHFNKNINFNIEFENFRLNNFEKESFSNFKSHLIKNCNLVEKLHYFINNTINQEEN